MVVVDNLYSYEKQVTHSEVVDITPAVQIHSSHNNFPFSYACVPLVKADRKIYRFGGEYVRNSGGLLS